MSTRWTRFVRGWLAAGCATATAAASHTIGGATFPSATIVVVALVFSAVVCVFLSGRRLSTARLGVSVVLSQLAYHALFLVSPSSGVTQTTAGAASTAGRSAVHDHGGAGSVTLVTDGAAAAAHSDMHGSMMWVAHAVAAVVTIAAIAHGEKILARLLAVGARFVVRLRAVRMPVPALGVVARPSVADPRVRAARELVVPSPLDIVLSALGHRGPPRAASSSPLVPAFATA